MTDIINSHKTSEREKIQAAYSGASNSYHHTVMGEYQRTSVRHLLVDINPFPAPGDSVLDLGCGTGIALFTLQELYPQIGELVGLDVSGDMLARARLESQKVDHPFSWVHGDAHFLPFPDTRFNLVISHNAFHWMPDRLKVLNELKRVLVPGGRIALLFEGAKSRENMYTIRRKVFQCHGLTPPAGFGQGKMAGGSNDAWNTVGAIEDLVEEAGFKLVDAWARESYMYIPERVVMEQFRSTAAYWQAGLSQEEVNGIFDELQKELKTISTPRGFREVLYPLNVIARKP